MKKGNRQSGDPRKRQAVKDIEICKMLTKRKNEQRGLEIKAELAQKRDETTDEALHLLELFEEQNPESSAFLYDETYYMIIFTALVVHRKGCELSGNKAAYNPRSQLDTLQIGEVLKEEIMMFLEANNLV